MSTAATTAKHRASAPPRRDWAGSRHPAPQLRAGLLAPATQHPPAKGTRVPGSHPPSPPTSITPPLLPGGPPHLGTSTAWVPGAHGPPSQWLPGGCGRRGGWVPGGMCEGVGGPQSGDLEWGGEWQGRVWPLPSPAGVSKGQCPGMPQLFPEQRGFQKKLPMAISE